MSKTKILVAAALSLGLMGIAQAGNRKGTDSYSYGSRGNQSAPVTAPEIDPASAGSALTLLMGGLAVLRGRRRSKG